MSERDFEQIGCEQVYEGQIFSVDRCEFRFPDGKEATREIVRHPGAVGIVPIDDEHVWLVRQPREAADDPDMLEIPAGKLDEDGEDPRQTAERELAEEIGKRAEHWESLGAYHSSVGFTDEVVHLYLATGISDVDERPAVEEDERIDVEVRPVSELDAILADTTDAKTLIALLKLRERLTGAGGAGH